MTSLRATQAIRMPTIQCVAGGPISVTYGQMPPQVPVSHCALLICAGMGSDRPNPQLAAKLVLYAVSVSKPAPKVKRLAEMGPDKKLSSSSEIIV